MLHIMLHKAALIVICICVCTLCTIENEFVKTNPVRPTMSDVHDEEIESFQSFDSFASSESFSLVNDAEETPT